MKRKPSVRTIWMFSREYGDLAGAGGVKDVVQQLAKALASFKSVKVRVVLPRYGFLDPVAQGFTELADPQLGDRWLQFAVDMNYGMEERQELCRFWSRDRGNLRLYLIEANRFAEKQGVYTYTEADSERDPSVKPGTGHYDYFAMNVLLQKAGLELMVALGERADVIHCHDAHTSLIPALMRELPGYRSFFRGCGCLVTVHNAGVGYHQEVADLPFAQAITGLSWQSVMANRLAGKFDPFIVAGSHALMNTVSENYARELQESADDSRTDWLGHALLQRGVTLRGVTNGIDPEDYNPADHLQAGIPAPFSPLAKEAKLPGKRACKERLLQLLSGSQVFKGVRQFGTLQNNPDAPLFTFIGRLSEQKGVTTLLAALPGFFAGHPTAQCLVMGTGSDLLEASILSLLAEPEIAERFCFLRGYDPRLANQVYAAGDFFVIPSQYEPCGLTDFIAQLFGNVPVVHHVGGLVKVRDGETGLAYAEDSPLELAACLARSCQLYDDRQALREMQRRAVQLIHERYTWDVVRTRYMGLYKEARELVVTGSGQGSIRSRLPGTGRL